MNLEGATTISLEIALAEDTGGSSISEVHTDTIFNKSNKFYTYFKSNRN